MLLPSKRRRKKHVMQLTEDYINESKEEQDAMENWLFFNYPMGMGKPMFVLELSTGEFWILHHQNVGVSKSRKKNMILKSTWIDQKFIFNLQLRRSNICSNGPKSCKRRFTIHFNSLNFWRIGKKTM